MVEAAGATESVSRRGSLPGSAARKRNQPFPSMNDVGSGCAAVPASHSVLFVQMDRVEVCPCRHPLRHRETVYVRSDVTLTGTAPRASLFPRSCHTRAWRSWGLCRGRHLLHLHIGIPLLEHGAQFAVECLDRVCNSRCAPLCHCIGRFFQARPHHLFTVDSTIPCGYGLAMTIPLAIIGIRWPLLVM